MPRNFSKVFKISTHYKIAIHVITYELFILNQAHPSRKFMCARILEITNCYADYFCMHVCACKV